MPRRTLYAVIGMMAILGATASPAVATDESLWLDSYDRDADGTAGPVSTQSPLAPGAAYIVSVEGTWNAWPLDSWSLPDSCGSPEDQPLFASPDVTNGRVGLDAEMIFAGPVGSFACRGGAPVPRQLSSFEIDSGTGYADPTPIGGSPTTPTAGHTYSYNVTGQGEVATFSFRLLDWPNDDNYGRLRIAVSKLSPRSLCDLTTRLAQSSARYAGLSAFHKRLVTALADAACRNLDRVGGLKPSKRAALLRAYKQSVAALVHTGWLTPAQGSELQTLADQL